MCPPRGGLTTANAYRERRYVGSGTIHAVESCQCLPNSDDWTMVADGNVAGVTTRPLLSGRVLSNEENAPEIPDRALRFP